MTTFYICRHGQTENNLHRRLSGWIDTPLTEEGTKNAHSAADKLQGQHVDQIISSDLGRAFVTAYIIAKDLNYEAEIIRNEGLREVNYGVMANHSLADYPHLSPEQNTTFIPAGGESLAQMQIRVLKCVNELSKPYPHKTVLLVAHDGTINALYAAFTKQDLGIVDAGRENAHDFVAKFIYEDAVITDFAEIAG